MQALKSTGKAPTPLLNWGDLPEAAVTKRISDVRPTWNKMRRHKKLMPVWKECSESEESDEDEGEQTEATFSPSGEKWRESHMNSDEEGLAAATKEGEGAQAAQESSSASKVGLDNDDAVANTYHNACQSDSVWPTLQEAAAPCEADDAVSVASSWLDAGALGDCDSVSVASSWLDLGSCELQEEEELGAVLLSSAAQPAHGHEALATAEKPLPSTEQAGRAVPSWAGRLGAATGPVAQPRARVPPLTAARQRRIPRPAGNMGEDWEEDVGVADLQERRLRPQNGRGATQRARAARRA